MSMNLYGIMRQSLAGEIYRMPVLLGIVSYVLMALGLYEMAKSRNLGKAWLAWVPVLNIWLLGSLSDQYAYVVKGQIRSRRKICLVLNILVTAILVYLGGGFLISLGKILLYSMDPWSSMEAYELFTRTMFRTGGTLLILLPVLIALLVFKFLVLYDVYRSCDPQNAVLYLVLSILVPVTPGFFLFFNRDKERGMPPRREADRGSGAEKTPEFL